jgi:hypothetical protein
MKIQAKALLSLFSLTLLSAPALLAAERMKSGEWEFTSTNQGQPAHTFKHCITAAEAASVNGDAKAGRGAAEKSAGNKCALKEYKIVGDTVTYTLACDTRTISSTATYHGNSFEGVLTTKSPGKNAVTRVKARYLGACP